ncbi:unnamed protein product [Phaeothamnion confervicola]
MRAESGQEQSHHISHLINNMAWEHDDDNHGVLHKRTSSEALHQRESASYDAQKRRRPTTAERLEANRQRNRIHARKTRERKKQRVQQLEDRSAKLQNECRSLQEHLDTARALLYLSFSNGGGGGSSSPTTTEERSCVGDDASEDESWDQRSDSCDFDRDSSLDDDVEESMLEFSAPDFAAAVSVASLPAGDRERLRRERNRLHARKTRMRKKLVLEALERKVLVYERRVADLRLLLVQAGCATNSRCVLSGADSNSADAAAADAAMGGWSSDVRERRSVSEASSAPSTGSAALSAAPAALPLTDRVEVLVRAAEAESGSVGADLAEVCARLDICAADGPLRPPF